MSAEARELLDQWRHDPRLARQGSTQRVDRSQQGIGELHRERALLASLLHPVLDRAGQRDDLPPTDHRRAALDRVGVAQDRVHLFGAPGAGLQSQQVRLHFLQAVAALLADERVDLLVAGAQGDAPGSPTGANTASGSSKPTRVPSTKVAPER